MPARARALTAALFVTCALPLCALAQPEAAPAQPAGGTAEGSPAAEKSKLSFSMTTGGWYTFEADVDDDNNGTVGSVSMARVGGEVNVGYALDKTYTLTLDVTPEFSWYDFSAKNGASVLGGSGSQTIDTYFVLVTPGVNIQVADRWTVRVAGLFNVAAETGADDDAFTYGGLAAVRYQINDKLAIGGGIAVITSLEDDPSWYPIITIDWQINDKVRLSSRGLGIELAVEVCPHVTMTLGGAYEPREYRLDTVGSFKNPVLRDHRIPVALGIVYKPCKNFEVFVRGGAVVWQEYTLDNSNGDEITQVNTDPAGFVGGGVTIRF